jgi:L-iditol 2-dehydrogenase
MKALVYYGPEDLRLAEIADPKPARGEALIRVKACGICGSDVHGYLGITGRRIPPMVMGHEFSGEVVETGEGVTDIRVGDRVAPYPVIFCGDFEQCRTGDVHLCLNKKALGVLECNGAMAEYISVPAKLLFKLADTVSYEVGSMMEPLAVSYRGVNHASDLTGKNVLVVGAGTIGLLVTAIVKMRNPAKVFVSDLNDARLDVAKKMGADVVINSSKDDLRDVINNGTSAAGVDVAFEAVGATPTVQQAMACLRVGGTAVWIGNSAKMININMQEIVTRELRVSGTFLYSLEEFGTVVGLLNDGRLNVEPMISLKAPMMEKGVELFARLAKDPGPLIKVILNN